MMETPDAGFAASRRLSPRFLAKLEKSVLKQKQKKLPRSSLPRFGVASLVFPTSIRSSFPGYSFCSSAADEGSGGANWESWLGGFYPLYQLGNPPTRIFRTDYFLTLVRPGLPLPEDTVQFRIPMDMTRIELKEYLEKIYNVPVAAVRTRIQFGSNKQRDDKNRRIKKPDYKVAYVQLAEGQTFQFPNLFPDKDKAPEPDSSEEIENKVEKEKQKKINDLKRGDVPNWFWH